MPPFCVCAVILCFREVVVYPIYIWEGLHPSMGQVYWYLYNVAIAMVVVVFDEQLSEFGVVL